MATLLDIARLATPLLPAIDWSTVEWWKGEQWGGVLYPERAVAEDALRSAGLLTESITAEQVQQAVRDARGTISQNASAIEAAARTADKNLATPVEFNVESLRQAIVSGYLLAYAGMDVHKPANVDILYRRGVFGQAWFKRDADLRHATFRIIILLDKWGLLSQLSPSKTGVKGLGLGPGALILIGVVAIATIAGIAWLAVAQSEIAANNHAQEVFCTNAQASNDPEQIRICGELLLNQKQNPKYDWAGRLTNALTPGTPGAPGQDDLFGWAIKWGALASIGYLAVTQVLPKLFEKRSKGDGGGGGGGGGGGSRWRAASAIRGMED